MSESSPRNAFGYASLALAAIGFGCGWVPATLLFVFVFALLAVVFGVLGCIRLSRGLASNVAATVAGLALGAGVLVLSVWTVAA